MNALHFLIPKSLVETITTESTVRQALEKMRFHRYQAIPMLDPDGKYVTTLRTDDLLRFFLNNGFDERIAEEVLAVDILNKSENPALSHTATMKELIESVKEHNFVPITDDRSCFIGIILRRDVLNYLLKYYPEEQEKTTK